MFVRPFISSSSLLHQDKKSAGALKKVIAWQIEHFVQENKIMKSAFAERMRTSHSQLDPENTNLSLKALVGTAHAMGKHVVINITD